MFSYFGKLGSLGKEYDFVGDMQMIFRNDIVRGNFHKFMKTGSLLKSRNVGACSEMHTGDSLWLFLGANSPRELEISGDIVLGCIEAYPNGGAFRNHMKGLFETRYGGDKMFHHFIRREGERGLLAQVILNTTPMKIKY